MPNTASKRYVAPPFRVVPESARRIYRTQLAVLALPAAAGIVFFGYQAAKVILVAVLSAGLMEFLLVKARRRRLAGSLSHSVMMGLLVALMLPADVRGDVVIVAAVSAVLLGKHLFGGLGQSIWHPALVGRLIAQMFYADTLAARGPLLARDQLVWGNIHQVWQPAKDWLRIDWFQTLSPTGYAGWLLTRPVEALRQMGRQDIIHSSEQMAGYLLDRLPSLGHCLLGAVPGGVGETCSVLLIVIGLYFIYRGYLPWKLPVMFLAGALLGALILPIGAGRLAPDGSTYTFPFLLADSAVLLTYINYHLFGGGLMLGAWVLAGEMSCRPITGQGQIIFGFAAGVLTMVFRLFTSMAIPCYAAILVMNSLTGVLDRLTRPRGPAGRPDRRWEPDR